MSRVLPFLFLLALTLPTIATAIIPLPPLSGPFSVGTLALETVDHTRLDPYAPTPGPRRLMTTFWYPTSDVHHAPAPYLTPTVAAIADQFLGFPPGTLEQFQTRGLQGARLKEVDPLPVLLFSPGLGAAREEYTIILSALASYGYLVVAIDHTYDAAVVEFPSDEATIFGIDVSFGTGDLGPPVEVRAKDTLHILGQLGNATFIQQIPGIVHRTLDTKKVGMVGHSLGGATALRVMELDDRVRGGVDFDGSFWGAEIGVGTNRPFLIMAQEGHNLANDASWASTWPKLTGFRRRVEIKGTRHLSFTDGGELLVLLGVKDVQDPGGATYGTIVPARMEVLQLRYVKGFFDFVLGDGGDKMFDVKEDPAFPEITIFK